MLLRHATPNDFPTLRTLLHAYFTEHHIQQPDTDADIQLALTHPTLGYILALVDNQPVACVKLRPLTLPNLHGTAVECKRLYVLPTHRGQKLASRLMDLAEQTALAAGHTWLYLDSNENFTTALTLYRRRGYTEISRFNTNPQATMFLRKELSV